MRSQSLSLIPLSLVAGLALAQDNGLESAAKRLLHDTARGVTPAEAPGMGDTANRSIEKAKNQKESSDRVPAIIQPPPPVVAPTPEPAKEAAKPEPAAPAKKPGKKSSHK